MRKKVDERIRTLIENGVKTRHRSMFVIIGDKSRDQIVNLHRMLSNSVKKSRHNHNVLWCYRDILELSSHWKKRAKQVKELQDRGLLDLENAEPLLRFLGTVKFTHCRYKDSERILGKTFGMCILQDFEALTPNLLARTIETVEGGGLVILLLRTLSSLTSLYTMVMDVHERFRTESHSLATGRFNERFLLSLASCRSCVVMDDELNILPISSHMRSITPVPVEEDSEGLSEAERGLKDLKEQLNDSFPVSPLIKMCCTLDQGKAVITFLDAILDKTLRCTVALLAGRGRGKSAALGLAIAGAVAAGYSNIYVTAPSPENLQTLFEFVSIGFDMLEYKKHTDYDIVKSSNAELKEVTIRINIYKQHRQTIQYIQPHEHSKLSQVELLVVDEAAAIPLPLVKSLLGPYLVFLSSTVNGYEGTGRSLSLKLLQQLEEQSRVSKKNTDSVPSGRLFRKIDLSEAIRYSNGDPIESWLNNLLCLDIANSIPSINRLPHPKECDLYYVNRDTLFSYHKDSELFLQRMMALYVASHYKNSPNDLQLLADAPAHHLFVLLGPVSKARNQLPDILCVIQVCLEGKISQASVMRSLSAGHQPSGDQIPWKFCEQFQDKDFPSLSGARIVRIATHPNAMRMGYGRAAMKLLSRYFKGKITSISEVEDDVQKEPESQHLKVTEAAEKVSLLEENIKPRSDLAPLLEQLHERKPEKLHYLGVSFGLTLDLFRFWRKHNKFLPFYICEVPNSVTGEHTCMMLRPLKTDDIEDKESDKLGFSGPYYRAFKAAFANLLCSPRFNTMEYKLARSILEPKLIFDDVDTSSTISHGIYDIITCSVSMGQLKSYVNNPVDHHHITHLKQPLAYLWFQEKIPVTLSIVQASVLLCMGLQMQDVSYVEGVMEKLERQQILSLFLKVMKKFYEYLNSVSTKQFSATRPTVKEVDCKPNSISVDEDLNVAAKKVKDDMKAKSDGLLKPELHQRYAIADKDVDFESALQSGGKIPSGGVVSVKSSKSKQEKHGTPKDSKSEKKRSNGGNHSSKSSKKKRTA